MIGRPPSYGGCQLSVALRWLARAVRFVGVLGARKRKNVAVAAPLSTTYTVPSFGLIAAADGPPPPGTVGGVWLQPLVRVALHVAPLMIETVSSRPFVA
jgi:hypothetical protein